MDDPKCSRDCDQTVNQEPKAEQEKIERHLQSSIFSSQSLSSPKTSKIFTMVPSITDQERENKNSSYITRPLIIQPSSQSPIVVQPRSDLASDLDIPECSHNQSLRQLPRAERNKNDTLPHSSPSPITPESFSLLFTAETNVGIMKYGTMPLIIRPSYEIPIMVQPRSNLQSSMSVIMPGLPLSLFLIALNKLNECPPSITGLNRLKSALHSNENETGHRGDVTAPDSLTSAPPSYSFVLRQMASRRRRLMGTFIPSPSFVQHTPPPTYATAFDIYVENRVTRTSQRIYNNFGFASMPAVCPECGYTGMTLAISKITLCTHLCAFILCLFCCWICAPLPYFLRTCKDVYHYCRNCRTFLGLYCPTNPDTNFN